MAISVKDFVVEVPVVPQIPKKKQESTQPKFKYEIVLQNNTDFVINKLQAKGRLIGRRLPSSWAN